MTVSIAAVPNYTAVKTEVPGHGFSVAVPNACAETDGHMSVFERQLTHSGVQFSPSTQSRTPPDSTFSESFKDGSQEVRACVCVCATLDALLKAPPPPAVTQKAFHLIRAWSQRWVGSSSQRDRATSVLLFHCLSDTMTCCTFLSLLLLTLGERGGGAGQ